MQIALTRRGRRLLSRRVPPPLEAVAVLAPVRTAGVPPSRPIHIAVRVKLRPR